MKPYVLELIEKEDLRIFMQIKQVVEAMPEIDLGLEEDSRGGRIAVSCHMLGRALAFFFPVVCKDGHFFSPGWSHSWLETKHGHIIDHYPWGTVGGPILIGNHFNIPGRHLYYEALVSGLDKEDFLGHVAKIAIVVRETIKLLGITI